jgi:limonene-1,2-epoxide hydrolase
MRKIMTGTLVLLLLATTAGAATYMKQENHTGEMQMMGQTQPARTDTIISWIGDNQATMFTPEGKILYHGETNKVYMIDDASKTYIEVPMEMIAAAADPDASLEERMEAMAEHMSPEEQAKMKEAMKQLEGNPQAKEMAEKMMGQMAGGKDEQGEPAIKATVTSTGESKTINGWDAEKYTVDFKMHMGEGTQVIWAAPDLAIDQGMYQMMKAMMMSQMEGFDDFIKEMEKVNGVPVQTSTTMTIMGALVETTSKLLEYETGKDAPEGMFDLPAGYEKQDMMSMGMGGR